MRRAARKEGNTVGLPLAANQHGSTSRQPLRRRKSVVILHLPNRDGYSATAQPKSPRGKTTNLACAIEELSLATALIRLIRLLTVGMAGHSCHDPRLQREHRLVSCPSALTTLHYVHTVFAHSAYQPARSMTSLCPCPFSLLVGI
jgi:hypothetical protein